MPLRRFASGKHYLTLTYKGKQLKFIAEFYHIGNAKEYWKITGNNGMIAINYHVQTKVIAQGMDGSSEKVPREFLEAVKAELDGRK